MTIVFVFILYLGTDEQVADEECGLHVVVCLTAAACVHGHSVCVRTIGCNGVLMTAGTACVHTIVATVCISRGYLPIDVTDISIITPHIILVGVFSGR